MAKQEKRLTRKEKMAQSKEVGLKKPLSKYEAKVREIKVNDRNQYQTA